MKDLVYELKALCQRNRDGSYSTQAHRWAILRQMGEQLLAAGYNQLHVYDLKGRHLNTLLKQWQVDNLSASTQKNRMAVLRWWAVKIGKGNEQDATSQRLQRSSERRSLKNPANCPQERQQHRTYQSDSNF